MKINVIFAVADLANGRSKKAFGHNNKLICRSKEDLQFFKQITMGYPLIMGRKTFESIGNKALPGRHSFIITSQQITQENCTAVPTLEAAIDQCDAAECFVIGGVNILYDAINNYADTMYLTKFDYAVDNADTVFDMRDVQWDHWYKEKSTTSELVAMTCCTNQVQVRTTFEKYSRIENG